MTLILGRVTIDRNDTYYEFTVLIIKQGLFIEFIEGGIELHTCCIDISTDTLTGASFTGH